MARCWIISIPTWRSFAALGIETATPFWNCILANAHFNYMEPSDATFNLQVYSTMAYGGRGIQYFTYFAPEIGNYRLAAIDQFGNRTSTWDMLRRINNQIHALAPTLIRLRSTGVYHYPDVPEQAKPLSQSELIEVGGDDAAVCPSTGRGPLSDRRVRGFRSIGLTS